MTGSHQQCAEVGVTDAELAVIAGRTTDRLGREIGEADRDVHRGDDQLHRPLERVGVEGVVVAKKLEQVEAGQVARAVVQAHVLRARIGCSNSAGLRIGVPVVDGVVVLDTGIGAFPSGPGHLAE